VSRKETKEVPRCTINFALLVLGYLSEASRGARAMTAKGVEISSVDQVESLRLKASNSASTSAVTDVATQAA
jgi:hypothetical protein